MEILPYTDDEWDDLFSFLSKDFDIPALKSLTDSDVSKLSDEKLSMLKEAWDYASEIRLGPEEV